MIELIKISNKIAASEPEAPLWGPFGQYLWSNFREGMNNEKPEQENELSIQVYNDIKNHFANKRIGLPITTASLLMLCQQLGWYKEILHPPPQQTLYRGLKIIGAKKLADLLGMGEEELLTKSSKDYDPGVNIKSTNGWSTSWSSKKKITKDFSKKGERGFAVTLIADVVDNPYRFFAGPGGLYDVEGLSNYHLEKETMGIEPINIKKIEWESIS